MISIASGGKGLIANPAINQLICDLCARTHTHHLIVCLTLRTLELLIVGHSTPEAGFHTLRGQISQSSMRCKKRANPT
jgi:hypothetical protein